MKSLFTLLLAVLVMVVAGCRGSEPLPSCPEGHLCIDVSRADLSYCPSGWRVFAFGPIGERHDSRGSRLQLRMDQRWMGFVHANVVCEGTQGRQPRYGSEQWSSFEGRSLASMRIFAQVGSSDRSRLSGLCRGELINVNMEIPLTIPSARCLH